MADGVGACTFRCRLGALTFWFKAGQHGPLNSRGVANDPHGFAGRDSDALLRGTKLLHLRPPIVVSGDRDHLEELLARHRAVKNPVLQPES